MHTTSVISQIFFLFFYFLLNSQIFYVSTRGRISQFFFSFFRVYTLLRKKKVEAKNTILFFLSTFGLLFQLTGMTSYFPILRLSFALRISLQVLKRNSRSSHFAHRIICDSIGYIAPKKNEKIQKYGKCFAYSCGNFAKNITYMSTAIRILFIWTVHINASIKIFKLK